MLREADAAELVSSRAAGRIGSGASPGLAEVPDLTLLRRPRVFTLGIVWESPQVRTATYSAHNVLTKCCKTFRRRSGCLFPVYIVLPHAAGSLTCLCCPQRPVQTMTHLSSLPVPHPSQAPADAIASTVAALRTEVDLGGVFASVPAGPRHVLRWHNSRFVPAFCSAASRLPQA